MTFGCSGPGSIKKKIVFRIPKFSELTIIPFRIQESCQKASYSSEVMQSAYSITHVTGLSKYTLDRKDMKHKSPKV